MGFHRSIADFWTKSDYNLSLKVVFLFQSFLVLTVLETLVLKLVNRALPSFDEGLLIEITLIDIINNTLNWKNFYLKFKIVRCTYIQFRVFSVQCIV